MLISIDIGKVKTKLTHTANYGKQIKGLSATDYTAIKIALNQMIDGDTIHTAGWRPGSNWADTVFNPIYLACEKNQTRVALLFGLIVYKIFMKRTDNWACGRYQLDGKVIKRLTYFRVSQ